MIGVSQMKQVVVLKASQCSNVGGGKCVPYSYEDAKQVQERDRFMIRIDVQQYDLDIDEEPEEEYSNVGKCVPN